jgi:L-ascorbate metabolism protein UlaG (beta-lactamase superfamily)
MSKAFEINNVLIERFGHASFQLVSSKRIYIDPYIIPKNPEKADFVFVTHEHFDHLDVNNVMKLSNSNTMLIAPPDCTSKVNKVKSKNVKPKESFELDEIKVETIEAYNINKFRSPGQPFHPKDKNWVGYVITINNTRIYHAGDTDFIPEMKNLKNIDVALVPIGGYYTMDLKEAAEAVNTIKPKIVVPMHYNTFPEIKADPKKFANLIDKNIEVKILE